MGFEPLIVSTQLVHGSNYKFMGNATPATLEYISYPAEVIIHVPLPTEQGTPIIVGIREV